MKKNLIACRLAIHNSYASQFGRSMIEMMGVLVIIGALSVGGMAGYTKALHQNKINTSIEQINVISGHLSTIGANGGNYEGMSNKSAIKLKAVLPEMNPSGDILRNPFGGEVTISSAKLLKPETGKNSGNDMAYTITYDGLDGPACIAIASHDWSSAKNSSLIGIAAGVAASVKSSDTENKLYLKCSGQLYNTASGYVVGCNNGSVNIPLSVGNATEACKACNANNNCAVTLKYF